MKYIGPEKRSRMSRFLDNEWNLLWIGLTLVIAGSLGILALIR